MEIYLKNFKNDVVDFSSEERKCEWEIKRIWDVGTKERNYLAVLLLYFFYFIIGIHLLRNIIKKVGPTSILQIGIFLSEVLTSTLFALSTILLVILIILYYFNKDFLLGPWHIPQPKYSPIFKFYRIFSFFQKFKL